MSSVADVNPSISPTAIRPFLEQAGFAPNLLKANFPFGDGLAAALVAFARPPADARTSCIVVVEAEFGTPELVRRYRPFAAPVILVCGRKGLEWWQQSIKSPIRSGPPIPPDGVVRFFAEHRDEFAPDAIYRAKTWGRFDANYQRTFVDLGLMPVVEAEIGHQLENLISRKVQDLKSLLGWEALSAKQGQWLLKSVFWLVSAKILRDKGVARFADIELTAVGPLLDALADHYDAAKIPITGDRQRRALTEIATDIARFSNLQLATTESLAHVYENTLISKATRQALGTHCTPSYLVDYVVGKLAPWIAEIPEERRNCFEPACGHAAFLVSAMRLLTELLPAEKSSPTKRRNYLRKRIHGCDVDDFALEIARLSLSLTDIPNPDGWDLTSGDMFIGDRLEQQASTVTVFLANPPFENFSEETRTYYRMKEVELKYVNKAAEMLGRVLPALPDRAVIGVVLPQGFLNSKNATPLRKLLIEDFEFREILLFPDKVFNFSDIESALLIARKGRHSDRHVRYRQIRERDMPAFRNDYVATVDLEKSQTDFNESLDLRLPDLGQLWEHCRSFGKLGEIAEIGQGFSFKGRDLPNGATTFSNRHFPQAIRGFQKFQRGIAIHELPPEIWLNLSDNVVLRPRHGTTNGVPQVLLNEARTSRGPWRLKALIDKSGHPVTSSFNVVRPKGSEPLEFFWALCNSPIANAFLYCHSGKRHNEAGVTRELPIPQLNKSATDAVADAARRYFASVEATTGFLQSPSKIDHARELLLRMDNEILKLYGLPRELEWQLLDFFAGWRREGLPFRFDAYFPAHFTDHVSLADYLAMTADWGETNRLRELLIRKKVSRNIEATERVTLEHLQSLATFRVRLLAPLPLKQLEEVHRQVVGTGLK